jgi:outer membrane receptor protein involved in Fe transport
MHPTHLPLGRAASATALVAAALTAAPASASPTAPTASAAARTGTPATGDPGGDPAAPAVAPAAPAVAPAAPAAATAAAGPPSPVEDPALLAYVADAIAEAEARALPRETIQVDGVAPVDTPSAGVRVVSARALELTPRRHVDDLLRLVPGVYLSQHGAEGKGQQFFLRGFDAVHGADLAIRVGGAPINEHSNVHGQGYADLGFVIPEVVSGLTARKGPFALEQGWFATAGSVDLELGVSTRGRRVGYEIGSTGRHRMVAIEAPATGPTAQFVAADLVRDAGFGEGRGTAHGSLLAQTEIAVGAARMRPSIAGYSARFGEPGVVPLADVASGYFDRLSAPAGDLGGRSHRILAGSTLAWQRGGDEIAAAAHLGWRGLALEENYTGFLESDLGDGRRQAHRAVTGVAHLDWRRRLGAGLRLLAGADLLRDQLRQLEHRVGLGGEVWRYERELAAAITSAGGWLGLEARRGAWTVTGGSRIDAMAVTATDLLEPMRSGRGAVAAASPRIAAAWRSARASLAVAAGRGQRPPEARAFTQRPSREGMEATTFDGGDPAITAASAVEVGGELRGARAAVGATGFATWIEREALFDHLSGTSALRDGSRRVGLEAYVEARPRDWLALRGDVTAVDARFVVTRNPVPGAPRLLGSVEARVDRAPWSAGLVGRVLGARPLGHGASAAASTVVDASAGWSHGRLTLQLQLDNLFGAAWNEGEYHFASRWDLAAPRSELPRVHASPGRPFGARLGATVQL